MRIAVVTCKIKPPSADLINDLESAVLEGVQVALPNVVPSTQSQNNNSSSSTCDYRLPSQSDDFVRELIQLCNFHGKSKQV